LAPPMFLLQKMGRPERKAPLWALGTGSRTAPPPPPWSVGPRNPPTLSVLFRVVFPQKLGPGPPPPQKQPKTPKWVCFSPGNKIGPYPGPPQKKPMNAPGGETPANSPAPKRIFGPPGAGQTRPPPKNMGDPKAPPLGFSGKPFLLPPTEKKKFFFPFIFRVRTLKNARWGPGNGPRPPPRPPPRKKTAGKFPSTGGAGPLFCSKLPPPPGRNGGVGGALTQNRLGWEKTRCPFVRRGAPFWDPGAGWVGRVNVGFFFFRAGGVPIVLWPPSEKRAGRGGVRQTGMGAVGGGGFPKKKSPLPPPPLLEPPGNQRGRPPPLFPPTRVRPRLGCRKKNARFPVLNGVGFFFPFRKKQKQSLRPFFPRKRVTGPETGFFFFAPTGGGVPTSNPWPPGPPAFGPGEPRGTKKFQTSVSTPPGPPGSGRPPNGPSGGPPPLTRPFRSKQGTTNPFVSHGPHPPTPPPFPQRGPWVFGGPRKTGCPKRVVFSRKGKTTPPCPPGRPPLDETLA